MTFGEVAGIVSLVWLVFGRGLKPTREFLSAWQKAGIQDPGMACLPRLRRLRRVGPPTLLRVQRHGQNLSGSLVEVSENVQSILDRNLKLRHYPLGRG